VKPMYPRWLLAGCVVLLVQADGKPGLRAGTSSRSKQPDVLDLPRNDSGIPSLQGCLQRLSSEYYSTYPVGAPRGALPLPAPGGRPWPVLPKRRMRIGTGELTLQVSFRRLQRSAQGSSPEDDMPLTQPTGNSPVTGSARLNFELRLREVAASDSRPDPVSTLADRLHGVTTLEELSAILEPADLFTNCQDSQALHRTISCILTQIVEENQADVGEVGQDPRFELRLLLPSPMFHAVRTVAKQQGWSAEALCQPKFLRHWYVARPPQQPVQLWSHRPIQ
ncbi:unnamed protein product, partial [Durusdinium trenchii]